jgi:hypothetical protein
MPTELISEKLQQELEAVIKTGDEAKFRRFISEHMREFPKDVQDDIIVALLEEALGQNNTDQLISDFQRRGVIALDILGKAQEELEREKKLREIKKSL